MSRTRGEGFNKEKFIFLLGTLGLGFALFRFLSSSPEELVVTDPLTTTGEPFPYRDKDYTVRDQVEAFLDKDRKSPFTIDDYQAGKSETKVVKNETGKTEGTGPFGSAEPPPPQAPKTTQDDTKGDQGPVKRTAKDLAVEFMGVIIVGDKRFALLSRKDGAPPSRVKKDDVIPDLNYKITLIENQAVHLTDQDGTPYVLKDNRFLGADGAGKDSAAAGGFTTPNLAPTPKAGPPQTESPPVTPAPSTPAPQPKPVTPAIPTPPGNPAPGTAPVSPAIPAPPAGTVPPAASTPVDEKTRLQLEKQKQRDELLKKKKAAHSREG